MDRMCRTEREADGRVDAAQEDKSCCGRWTNQTGFRLQVDKVQSSSSQSSNLRISLPLST